MSPLRSRLSAAACLLLASGAPGVVRADGATSQFDATGLLYGERARARVVEPTARITHFFPDGQSLSAQLGIDVITGASPTGAQPPGRAQTITSPSGTVMTIPPGSIPLSNFKDTRGALDVDWKKPLGLLTPTIGGHFSREKDYQSLGANAKLSLDLMHRLTTVTVGAGINHDGVFPVGGTTAGLADASTIVGRGSNPKRVTSAMLGLSRVLTRRWMLAVNGSRTHEKGYLTEPYKIVSLLNGSTGLTTGSLTEKRPSTRDRKDILTSSVYHLAQDVLYLSYRYYWDDWNVRSHTFDLRYRRELGNEAWLQPHLRYYTQTAASFFRFGLVQGAPRPDFATSDYRLGALRTVTLGATYGFHLPDYPGEWSVRAEFIGQFGDGHPKDAIGVQRQFDLFPRVNIGSLVVGYSIEF
jgi:hypothetical protein